METRQSRLTSQALARLDCSQVAWEHGYAGKPIAKEGQGGRK